MLLCLVVAHSRVSRFALQSKLSGTIPSTFSSLSVLRILHVGECSLCLCLTLSLSLSPSHCLSLTMSLHLALSVPPSIRHCSRWTHAGAGLSNQHIAGDNKLSGSSSSAFANWIRLLLFAVYNNRKLVLVQPLLNQNR